MLYHVENVNRQRRTRKKLKKYLKIPISLSRLQSILTEEKKGHEKSEVPGLQPTSQSVGTRFFPVKLKFSQFARRTFLSRQIEVQQTTEGLNSKQEQDRRQMLPKGQSKV